MLPGSATHLQWGSRVGGFGQVRSKREWSMPVPHLPYLRRNEWALEATSDRKDGVPLPLAEHQINNPGMGMKRNLIVDAGHGAMQQIEVGPRAVLQIELQIIDREN